MSEILKVMHKFSNLRENKNNNHKTHTSKVNTVREKFEAKYSQTLSKTVCVYDSQHVGCITDQWQNNDRLVPATQIDYFDLAASHRI